MISVLVNNLTNNPSMTGVVLLMNYRSNYIWEHMLKICILNYTGNFDLIKYRNNMTSKVTTGHEAEINLDLDPGIYACERVQWGSSSWFLNNFH